MPTQTTGSVNIATLDSAITSNLCTGIFSVDILPSVFIGAGADNILGANVRITNPYNVVIKQYPTSGYDIYPPFTDVVEVDIPTQASNYQYGQYKVEVELTDADGTLYTITKLINICVPDANNKTRKYGSLSAQLNGICKEGKVYVKADGVPNYNGATSDSQESSFHLEYPTSSGKNVLDTSVGSFSDDLYEGVYKFTGTICAHYSFGDNVFANVNYILKREKNIRCLLDETCIYAKLAQLDAQTKSDCTEGEKIDTQNVIIGALRLIKTIEVASNAGFDAGDYIDELEDLLGCVCTCNCADGTPVINTNPSKDFIINGCNVTKDIVGLTDTYTIDNYAYVVAITPNGNAITITTPTLADCTKTQTITFNIAVVYSQIKNQIVNSAEYNFWASVTKNSLAGLDVTCLGITTDQFNAMTNKQFTQAILNQLCIGGACNAQITDESITNTAANVIKNWNNDEEVYEVAAYLDGVLKGTVLAPVDTFTFVGAADGDNHTWTLVAKCTNGAIGNSLNGTFTYFGCPSIATPVVSLNSIPSATCPYDLTALVSGLASGITAEWHNLNNTNTSSLVATPTGVSDGAYFVFGKDSNGCYSASAQVIVVCSEATNCSAPQNLLVENITDGFRVRFQGAAFPPPLNSYTVKRRLSSDPDTSGSYTTIGTPTWNATVNRWEILDETGVDNTLYSYRAVSNCGTTAPYVDYIFANILCPTLALTSGDNQIGYSFAGVGGGIDKYEVKIYESDGVTLVHTDTVLPSFPNPITGTFLYLGSATTYKVRIKAWIGTYSKDCALSSQITNTTEIEVTGSVSIGDPRSLVVNLNDSIPCEVVFGFAGTYDNSGTPTSFSANVTVAADDTEGTGNDVVPVGGEITCIVASDSSYSVECSGITYNFILTVNDPCEGV